MEVGPFSLHVLKGDFGVNYVSFLSLIKIGSPEYVIILLCVYGKPDRYHYTKI